MSPALMEKARELIAVFSDAGLTVATVESCTGGLITAAMTEIPGSSAVVDRGFVTYSNEAKTELVGVPAALIDARGAVSEEVAKAMAEGGLGHSRADIVVAVTGIAGPGGSDFKHEGLVHFHAVARSGEAASARIEHGAIGRAAVREATAIRALDMALKLAGASLRRP